MWLILAASHTPGWETYGPLGLLAAGLLAFASKAYKREADRADRLEAELREFLPKLLKALETLDEALRTLEKLGYPTSASPPPPPPPGFPPR